MNNTKVYTKYSKEKLCGYFHFGIFLSLFPDFDFIKQVAFKRKRSEYENYDNWCDVSANRSSEVWKHYLYNSATKQAKCNVCQDILAAGNGTKSLISHLRGKHSIIIQKLSNGSRNTTSSVALPLDIMDPMSEMGHSVFGSQ